MDKLYPGIEIDCTYKDTNFHLLGYGIDYPAMEEIIDIIHTLAEVTTTGKQSHLSG